MSLLIFTIVKACEIAIGKIVIFPRYDRVSRLAIARCDIIRCPQHRHEFPKWEYVHFLKLKTKRSTSDSYEEVLLQSQNFEARTSDWEAHVKMNKSRGSNALLYLLCKRIAFLSLRSHLNFRVWNPLCRVTFSGVCLTKKPHYGPNLIILINSIGASGRWLMCGLSKV